MKKQILILLLLAPLISSAQTTTNTHINSSDVVNIGTEQKPGATVEYKLTEPQVILLSNILNAADVIAGNSATVSTAQYREFHASIVKLDSVIRTQYLYYHPIKKEVKPSNK